MDELRSAMTEAETAFDVACQAFRDAQRALARSKAKARHIALHEAERDLDNATEAFRIAREAYEDDVTRQEAAKRRADRSAARRQFGLAHVQLRLFA